MRNLIIILFLSLICLDIYAQEKTDSIKKGWDLGFIPAIAFDSDLGVFYGIIIQPVDFGNGSRYPNYFQTIRLQIARYSRGSSEHYVDYDSFSLIPGYRLLAGARYVGNQGFPFYGFNGNESYYNPDWENDEDSVNYKSRMFYRQDRRFFQVYANIQDTIGKSRFQWRAGWSLNNYNIDTVNITKLNSKLDEDNKLPHTPSLYEQYTDWGIISDDEKNGGLVNSLLLGLIYDSRNKLNNPDKGIYSELNIRWIPSFMNKNNSAINLGVTYRQYLPLIKRRLIFAYRIMFNANLGGDPTYFTRTLLTTFSATEGFGGAGTMRGVLMNRIVVSDFLMGNFELRCRLVNFRFINKNWYIGAVAFMDAGRILKPVKIDMTNVPSNAQSEYFRGRDNTIHKSIGGGLKLAMNENFILSAEYARALDIQDRGFGLYLGLDYLF
jgi:hypothetical protein